VRLFYSVLGALEGVTGRTGEQLERLLKAKRAQHPP